MVRSWTRPCQRARAVQDLTASSPARGSSAHSCRRRSPPRRLGINHRVGPPRGARRTPRTSPICTTRRRCASRRGPRRSVRPAASRDGELGIIDLGGFCCEQGDVNHGPVFCPLLPIWSWVATDFLSWAGAHRREFLYVGDFAPVWILLVTLLPPV